MAKKGSIDNGMFDFQKVMNEFYNNKPGEDDAEGRAIKNNFQANMVQSAFDASLAKDMAYSQAELAQANMTQAADLEQRNTQVNMAKEFDYGMQSMDAQFEAQDKFASNQHERDLGTLTATGEQNRTQIETQGQQDQLLAAKKGEMDNSLAKVQGEYNIAGQKIGAKSQEQVANTQANASRYASAQDRVKAENVANTQADASRDNTQTQANASMANTKTQAKADRYGAKTAAQASKYGSKKTAQSADKATAASITNTQTQADASMANTQTQAQADKYGARKASEASMYGADATKEASIYGSKKAAQASMYGADATKEASMYGSKKAAQASMYGADRSLDATKDTNRTSTKNIKVTGDQSRQNMSLQDQLDAGKENRQSARSRSMARSF